MNKFRTKLLIALITLIISVLVGLGILLGQLFKSYYLQSFNERLKIEKNLLGTYIEEHGGVSSFKQQDVLKISDMLNVRATITDQHGNILYDSGEFNDLSSTGLKKIIDDVVKKKIVKEARLEEGDGYDLHYYWKALTKDAQKEGYIFLSTKTDELNQAYSQIW